ncbi:MAG: PilT/PilU family type 4a pilus ATPase [Armatimonadota bacterium]
MTVEIVNINKRTAGIIEKRQLLPVPVLNELLARAETLQEWLGQVAVDDGLLSAAELATALSKELQLSLVNLKSLYPDENALAQLPAETCRTNFFLPLSFDGSTLSVAMANPLDETALATLRSLTGSDISVQIASLDELMTTINQWYRTTAPQAAPRQETDTVLAEVLASLGKSAESGTGESGFQDRAEADRLLHELSLDQLLTMMMENHASDLHLAVGSPPMMRVDGELRPMPFPTLTPSPVQTMVYAILTDVQITTFERRLELDFAYSLPKISRFRVNVLRQRGSIGAVFRTIPEDMPNLDQLKMPPVVREMTGRPRGLVLVTGPTGSGKSTTLAAMIDEINRTRRAHVVTVEDPIEFLHRNNLCVITQREVGADTESFSIALRHVLRQDPDVILIGEMRDLETVSAAVTAAETGHLVFATLHTTSAAQTIERIIDVFPPHQQDQIRSQLSNTLEAIFTQTLLVNIDGHGRSCAMEILICTPAIRNLIREGKVHQMPSVLQASAKYGMQTLDQSLKQLVLNRKVSLEEAILKASNPEDFKSLVAMQ